MSFVEKFKIKPAKNENRYNPHYTVYFEMENTFKSSLEVLTQNDPDNCDLFWLLIAYLKKYRYWERDEFLSSIKWTTTDGRVWETYEILDWYQILLRNPRWEDFCESYSEISVKYFDEFKKVHAVEIPDIDECFPNKEDLKEALLKAFKEGEMND